MINQKKVTEILKNTFGFESFRFDQEKIINSILSNNDTLAIMPTGGGKSLCYQLPALYFDGVTVIVSPLISLMSDQVAGLDQLGIKSCYLNSTLSASQKQDVEEKLLTNQVKILYIAPEGILTPSTLNLLKNIKLSLIAVDEAHCVSQWGHEFRSDYMRLNELKKLFPKTPTIALTATADSKTRKDICSQLELKNENIFVSTFDRPNIKYMVYERKNEIRQLDDFLKSNHKDHTGIVYCLSRKKVESVTKELKKLGYNASAYHAGLSTIDRAKSQDKFNNQETIIIVATIAFGMGIDRPDVRFVAHLDLPKSIEGYYQETGRAGRDGEPSSAWMVYGLSDVVKLSRMLEMTDANEVYKKSARNKLDAILGLCEAVNCRRKILLSYFGESILEQCGNCDSCLEPAELWDATIEAQKLLSTISRTNQTFGAGYLIDILRGSENAKILGNNHQDLSVFGIGKDHSKMDWSSITRQLLNLGYIKIKDWEYRNIALTEKSMPLLKGATKVHLRKLQRLAKKIKPNRRAATKTSRMTKDHNRPELFESLRQLRRTLATEAKVPPYVVFSDKTLHEMCLLLPRTKGEMLMVNGVGETKYEKFGPKFIKQIGESI